eukprot:5742885-Karenia_brevis.AAC.1
MLIWLGLVDSGRGNRLCPLTSVAHAFCHLVSSRYWPRAHMNRSFVPHHASKCAAECIMHLNCSRCG